MLWILGAVFICLAGAWLLSYFLRDVEPQWPQIAEPPSNVRLQEDDDA